MDTKANPPSPYQPALENNLFEDYRGLWLKKHLLTHKSPVENHIIKMAGKRSFGRNGNKRNNTSSPPRYYVHKPDGLFPYLSSIESLYKDQLLQ